MTQGQQFTSQPPVFRTRHGAFVRMHQANANDAVLIYTLLSQASERALQLRYMRSGQFHTEMLWLEAQRMAQTASPEQTTLLATTWHNGFEEFIAVAEMVRDTRLGGGAEIAFLVRDDMQQQGVATRLCRRLIDIARGQGISHLDAAMFAENFGMRRLITSLGLPYTSSTSYGETTMRIALLDHPKEASVASAAYKLAA